MARQVFFPLRSNARALVAGAGVQSVRRRLKLTSLVYDEVYVEDGVLAINAGPHGSFSGPEPLPDDGIGSWQTARGRQMEQTGRFSFSIAEEDTPGVASTGPFFSMIDSEATISWTPTFLPFARELPAAVDWIHPVRANPLPMEVKRLLSGWERRDAGNPTLLRDQPVDFVRKLMIKHANQDLGVTVTSGLALSADPLHRSVLQARLAEDAGWKLQGFALPLLFPYAPDLDWSDIAALRNDKNLVAYRSLLQELEEEVLAETVGGDVERAVHIAYEKRLRDANGKVERLGAAVAREVVGFGVGIGAGVATMPISGPIGPILGALPAVASTANTLRKVIQGRRTRRWIAFDWRLHDLT